MTPGWHRIGKDGGAPGPGGVVALVPIRALTGGKTRLAGLLPPEARAALARRMLTGVVRAALASGAVGAVAVVSPDPAALAAAAAEGAGVYPLVQPGPLLAADPAVPGPEPGLNAALDAGRAWALAHGAAALLVLSADLPLLAPADVRNLVRRDAPLVLAPDRHGLGTNALLLRLGGPRAAAGSAAAGAVDFRFGFGPGSYARHVAEAHRLGLDHATAVMPGTALDLDTPDDLRVADAGWWMPDAGWWMPDAGRTDGALASSLGERP